ncbi:hypothetical protein HHL11_31120 [Ramlibacter sp. G-1-2-2]|uniref:Uncharacterized protein n=1 Tax=Ramlibacter agri TaxID=2728837 RepID=A0A848HFX9_9BURK|nr:hypothetical protein [Ramlibacter agri]NML48241.1 hypothetical protein [Ramlibacter agri]
MRSLSLGRRLRLLEAALSSWPWYAQPVAAHPAGSELDPVREAMRAVAQATPGFAAARLVVLVRSCKDLHGLWHLRMPLAQALAAAGGEAHARREMVRVDAAFRAVWPDAPVSRSSDLR